MQKYGLVQKVIFDEYYVVIAGRTPQATSDTFFHALLTSQQFNALYDRLVTALGTINFFLFERKDYIVTMLPRQLVPKEAGLRVSDLLVPGVPAGPVPGRGNQ